MRINRTHPLLQKWDTFLYSPAYFLWIGALTVLSNALGLEIIAYPCMILTGICVCLFGRDLLPLIPIFICAYISPSTGNNPAFQEKTLFSTVEGILFIGTLLAALVASLIYRLVTDADFGGRQFLQKKRRLLPGMLVLGICYAVSGLGSGQWEKYGLLNLAFSLVQFISVAGLYWLLSGAVRWEKAPRNYLAWTGVCVGYVLLAELLNIYLTAGVIENGTINRNQIFTGWGHYNNMGALLAMSIPLAFFMTGKSRHAGFAYFTGLLFYIGLLLTCSRGSILFGTVIYVSAYILTLFNSRNARRQIFVHIVCVLVPLALGVIFFEDILQLFDKVVDLGITSKDRYEGYILGMKQFRKFPIFGGSFYPLDEYTLYIWADLETYRSLIPARWHNTLVQLLATGGISCLLGYAYHRAQTVCLFVKNFSTEKLFAALSILALLLTSLIDCHFFNVGPVFLYSAALAFVEFRLDGKE